VPLGVIAALYLREYARQGLVTSVVRIAVNNLAGVPSIVYGVFGLGFFCYTLGRTSTSGPARATPLRFDWWLTLWRRRRWPRSRRCAVAALAKPTPARRPGGFIAPWPSRRGPAGCIAAGLGAAAVVPNALLPRLLRRKGAQPPVRHARPALGLDHPGAASRSPW
jgi:hypothetical protein